MSESEKFPAMIYEDEFLAVINKPWGMVVNEAKTVRGLTVQAWFLNKLVLRPGQEGSEFAQKGGVVHRLDKDTSGIMVLAKTLEAYENLKLQFLERRTEKVYQALVHGEIKPESGIISLPIERHPKMWGKYTVGTDLSLTAITEWEVEKKYEVEFMNINERVLTLVNLKPHTGRTHQLRVHMKHKGNPIVADPWYLGKKMLEADEKWCPRLWLHACSLKFVHPLTGEKMNFMAELPNELKQVLLKLVH